MTREARNKSETIQIRLTGPEKQAFVQTAELAGIPVSAWVRGRLRQAAIRELEAAGRRVPFVEAVSLKD